MTDRQALLEALGTELTAQPADLPVFHPIAVRLQRMLAGSDYTADEVAGVASEDPALAGQMLRMANSAVYAGRAKAATIKEAVIRLGAHQVANLVMAASQAQLHSSHDPVIDSFMKDLWQHSHGCAVGARWMARTCGLSDIIQEVYLAGLLHDVGKLFFLKGVEGLKKELRNTLPESVIEETLDELHVEQGLRLMEHWNFPDIYLDVVRGHHGEEWDRENEMLAVVRLVNRACRKVGLGLVHEAGIDLMATEEAEILGVKRFDLDELEIIIEDSTEIGF